MAITFLAHLRFNLRGAIVIKSYKFLSFPQLPPPACPLPFDLYSASGCLFLLTVPPLIGGCPLKHPPHQKHRIWVKWERPLGGGRWGGRRLVFSTFDISPISHIHQMCHKPLTSCSFIDLKLQFCGKVFVTAGKKRWPLKYYLDI